MCVYKYLTFSIHQTDTLEPVLNNSKYQYFLINVEGLADGVGSIEVLAFL
jgi:hypothetical protein